jgi:hypothetical protein
VRFPVDLARAAKAAVASLALAGCADETVSGYAAEGPWRLTEIDGRPAEATMTLTFRGRGRVEGTLPCRTFSARQTAPYPWFELTDMRPGDVTCVAGEAERRVLDSLASATLAEALGGVLILSDEGGPLLVFRLG